MDKIEYPIRPIEEIPVVTQRARVLEVLLEDFNTTLAYWESTFGARANFGFRYKEDGHKEIYVLDEGDEQPVPQAELLTKVSEIMADAPTQVIDGDAKGS